MFTMNIPGNDDSNLLSALVQETLETVDENDVNSKLDLSSYFEMRSDTTEESFEDHILEDTMIKRGVLFSSIKYCSTTSCFNFSLEDNQFTCPENWGDFQTLKTLINKNSFNMIDKFNENFFVDHLFSSFVSYDYEQVCFVGKEKAFLIFLPKENEEILSWLKKYCEVSDIAA